MFIYKNDKIYCNNIINNVTNMNKAMLFNNKYELITKYFKDLYKIINTNYYDNCDLYKYFE
jgi:hypothetical protein